MVDAVSVVRRHGGVLRFAPCADHRLSFHYLFGLQGHDVGVDVVFVLAAGRCLMDVLGVDQSLTMSGLALISGGEVTLRRIPTTPVNGSGLEGVRDRIRYIVGQTLQWAPRRCMTVIEAPYVPKRMQAGAVIERMWLFGMLVDQLLIRGPVVQVRTTTRAMYAADNGSAKKAEVLAAMVGKFPALTIRDDNEADALAMAAMGVRFLGSPVDGPISKKMQQAMTSTVWPNPKESK